MKIPMGPPGIETAIYRPVAHCVFCQQSTAHPKYALYHRMKNVTDYNENKLIRTSQIKEKNDLGTSQQVSKRPNVHGH